MTMAAGIGVAQDEAYTKANCKTIMENRAFTMDELKKLGFICTDSMANFIFATHPDLDGEVLYQKLKEKGILVRQFSKPAICAYNRITVGTRAQMEAFIRAVRQIMEETK